MRKKLIIWLFKYSQLFYIQFKKKTPWNISKQQLLSYSKETLGYKLGEFLNEHNFELLPKVERHDAYHLITGYGTKVEDEIALQFLCFGNGKRSPYLLGVLCIGSLLLPEYYSYYLKSYQLGKNCNTFHHFNYKNLLNYSFKELQNAIFSKQELQFINNK